MNKISFFDRVFNIVIIITMYILMTGLSFILVSLTYYSHENERIIYDDSIICVDKNVKEFNAYQDEQNIYIYVEFEKKQSDTEILTYGYTYMNYYKKNVYLECLNEYTFVFVTVCVDGTSSIV